MRPAPVWLLLHEGSIRVCNTRDECQTLDDPCRLLRIGANGDLQDPGTWNALPQTREVNFEAAFPFVVNPPSIDATPIFTRDDIELGRCPEPKVRKAEEPTPKVHKAETDRRTTGQEQAAQEVCLLPAAPQDVSEVSASQASASVLGSAAAAVAAATAAETTSGSRMRPRAYCGRLADHAMYEGELGAATSGMTNG